MFKNSTYGRTNCPCIYMYYCGFVSTVRDVMHVSLNVRISVTSNVSSDVFSISQTKMVPVHDYEKRYVEACAI